jgi:hypothetical protein
MALIHEDFPSDWKIKWRECSDKNLKYKPCTGFINEFKGVKKHQQGCC